MGQTVCTRGALKVLKALSPPADIEALFRRHAEGDWGVMDAEDKASNEEALKEGGTLHSAYQVAPTIKVWIITEPDRSATTLLLPNEYEY